MGSHRTVARRPLAPQASLVDLLLQKPGVVSYLKVASGRIANFCDAHLFSGYSTKTRNLLGTMAS